jgi:hypothetical protein
MPINCSAEILEAIKDAPIAHQVNEPSAKKKSCVAVAVDTFFFFLEYTQYP